MPAFLHEVTLHKQREVATRRAVVSQSDLERQAQPVQGRFLSNLSGSGIKLIAEIKPSSPSAGTLKETVNLDTIVPVYDRFASAISVLADAKYFGGSLDLLSKVAGFSSLPVLCKDFIIDEYQVLEARVSGAQAVLLIVKMLGDNMLARLHKKILELGMTPVVEVQNEDEVNRALSLSPQVVLINNRDLNTFVIDMSTTIKLAPLIPADVLVVGASGINSRQDLDRLLPVCSRFLVGSSLMQADDLEGKFRELCKA